MNENNINIGIKVVIIAIVVYLLYKVANKFLQGFGLIDTKAEIATDKKVTENVQTVKEDLKKIANDIKNSKVLTTQQKALLRPTYSASKYKELAQKLYEAFNHLGTSYGVVKDTFAQLKNRTDVLNLIDAYGVRQIYLFGLPDGKPADLVSHLVSENQIENANAGLKVNNVYYKF